jgi:glucosamine--fructose-6-phosphate aminotransferase (isomerizing)
MSRTENDQQMLAEILNQPNAWADTIGSVEASSSQLLQLVEDCDEVVFTGCGSGLNAALAIAPTFQHFTGIKAQAVPAAEVVFFPETVFVDSSRYLVVLISRSGSTTETVMACDVVQGRKMRTLAITCYPESALVRKSAEALVLESANEASVTTTQSLTSMILCGQVMSGVLSKNVPYLERVKLLPQLGRAVIDEYHDMGQRIAENEGISKFAFVGSGPLRGIAREGQLKIKEMVLLPSDSYPLLDYRHGPKSNVDEHMLITVLLSDRARRVEIEFLAEMKSLGGRLFVLCDKADRGIRQYADYLSEVESGLSEFARGILYLPPIHFLAYYKSLSLGLSPSSPLNLTYWVETSNLSENR